MLHLRVITESSRVHHGGDPSTYSSSSDQCGCADENRVVHARHPQWSYTNASSHIRDRTYGACVHCQIMVRTYMYATHAIATISCARYYRSKLEYDHIRELAAVGGNDVLVCAIKPEHAAVLPDMKTTSESITSTGTMAVLGVPAEQVCFLDLRATQTLSPDDAEKFSHFVFGGILVSDPHHTHTHNVPYHHPCGHARPLLIQ